MQILQIRISPFAPSDEGDSPLPPPGLPWGVGGGGGLLSRRAALGGARPGWVVVGPPPPPKTGGEMN